ncbi:MAG: RNA polymerase sigma-70 factor [Bacteroidetes bacterium]|jgi:RNA polymerase sigma-70 factor (ECF subfamily)|nr:RNA polymerase sigma-70 factor [Bacteroidota bacterium]
MNQPDKEQFELWAEKIQQSDRRAFDSLFRSVYSQFVNFAATYTHEKSSAADIVQDSFILLWQNRTSIDPDQSLKAYLYRIVRNRSLNFLRNRSSEIAQSEIIVEEKLQPAEEVDSNEKADELSEKFGEWIEQLPERQQEAFELSRFEGLNHEEIASVMDVSPKTVNNHIVAALKQLRSLYEEYSGKSSHT